MFFLTGKLDLPFTVLFFPDPPPGEDRMVTTNAPRTAHASRVSQHSTCTWVCTQPPALTLLSSAARQPLITRSFSSFSKHCVTPSHLSRYHAGHDRPLPILVPWQLHTYRNLASGSEVDQLQELPKAEPGTGHYTSPCLPTPQVRKRPALAYQIKSHMQ